MSQTSSDIAFDGRLLAPEELPPNPDILGLGVYPIILAPVVVADLAGLLMVKVDAVPS